MAVDKIKDAVGEQRDKQQSAGIQSIEIGMRVLDAFANSTSPMSLKQICQVLGMAPSKVHRYLVSFVRSGMLTQFGANGVYDLGPTARRLGLTAMGRVDAFAVASRELLWLRDAAAHTVCLTVWGDAGPTMVRWEEGPFPLLINIRLGSVMPLGESAIGRLFLAHLPKLLTQPVLKRQRQLAGLKGDSAGLSEDELAKIRGAKSIHLSSAMIAGIDAIAAPVFESQGGLSSVLCLLGPHQTLQGSAAARCYRQVEEAARRVSFELGHLSEGDITHPPA